MLYKVKKWMLVLVCCVGILCFDTNCTRANDNAEYQVIVDDGASLLSKEEITDITKEMKKITEYGNVAFVSISNNPYGDTEEFAEEYYRGVFGKNSGTVFVIDMNVRSIAIFSDGAIYERITTGYADTITDNVYTYATDGKYYDCAKEAFNEISILLDGGEIAQPMKYVSNLLLAIILAMLINYLLAMYLSRPQKTKKEEINEEEKVIFNYFIDKEKYMYERKISSSSSDGSSFGSGGSSGGGGFSGGSSGGGGSHRF